MPLFRTDTGCKCRKTLVSITTTRLRRSLGAGWRKILFQTCEPRINSPRLIALFHDQGPLAAWLGSCQAASGRAGSHLDKRLRVAPLAAFLLELLALVHDDLAVVADANRPALQRPGSRPLEVDAGDVETRTVTGTLELGL